MIEKEVSESVAIGDEELREVIDAVEAGRLGFKKPYRRTHGGGGLETLETMPPGRATADAPGWIFVVFFDAGEWDYIDHVLSPDGRRRELNLDSMAAGGDEFDDLLADYAPENEALDRWLGVGR